MSERRRVPMWVGIVVAGVEQIPFFALYWAGLVPWYAWFATLWAAQVGLILGREQVFYEKRLHRA